MGSLSSHAAEFYSQPFVGIGLRVCSLARPRLTASSLVRFPAAKSLLPVLSCVPHGCALTFRFGWPNAPDGNFHPARLSTCRAHERGLKSAATPDHPPLPDEFDVAPLFARCCGLKSALRPGGTFDMHPWGCVLCFSV